jgi:hypothetical protein
MKKMILVLPTVVLLMWRMGSAPLAAPPPYDLTVVVTPNDLARCGPPPTSPACGAAHSDRKWFFYDDVKDLIDNTMGHFVICQYGPCPYYDTTAIENPPLGVGSAQISTVLNRRPNLATYQFGGVRLASITTLKYSNYNPSAGNKTDPTRSGYLQFNVDFTGTSTAFQRRLTFVPRNNPPVMQDKWQERDGINGGLAMWTYSGATWPTGTTLVPGPACVAPGTTPKSWSLILQCYPNSRILPGDSFLGIRVGEPYADGYTENLDAFKFGTAAGTLTFDFEPYGCSSGHGDGDMDGQHGGSSHGHFHKKGCGGDGDSAEEDDNVKHSDPSAGTDFTSTSITSSTVAIDDSRRTVTMVGTGVNNGLPVAFTMIAVDNGDVAPGVFTLTLSDGYSITRSLTAGAIVIR